jgi:Protein of unknown function (DUF3712)
MALADSAILTGSVTDFDFSFQDQTIIVLDDILFKVFLGLMIGTASVPTRLNGIVDVVAVTSIGNVSISDIPFDASSTLTGLNSFGNIINLSDVSITGSGGDNGSQYIVVSLVVILENPSNISLNTNTADISFATFYEETFVNTLHKSYTVRLQKLFLDWPNSAEQ